MAYLAGLSSEVTAALISGVTAAALTLLGSRLSVHGLKRDLKQCVGARKNLQAKLRAISRNVEALLPKANKYQEVAAALSNSLIVYEVQQPVLLLGPRNVGKTSLLAQWHVPWDYSETAPNVKTKSAVVPVFQFKPKGKIVPHFADPEVKVPVKYHLSLNVYDFPGDLKGQESAKEIAKAKTKELRKRVEHELGLVLISMFDAQETLRERTRETTEYYNAELFKNLRHLVIEGSVKIERLVLVFNKFDLLMEADGGKSSREKLQKLCLESYADILKLLRGICHPERVCEVFTIVGRENILVENQGAPIVLGEAARNLVVAVAGEKAVEEMSKDRATSHAASHLG